MDRRFGFSLRGTVRRCLLSGAAMAALAVGTQSALAHGSVSLDIGIGAPLVGVYGGAGFYGPPVYGALTLGTGWRHRGWHGGWRGWGPGWVLVAPPVVWAAPPPVEFVEPAPVSVGPTRPDPVIVPRQGQDARQTEADRQQCNRWAVTQPAALADAQVFQRTVDACMDARGYTTR
jgi:hypothetical protein